MLEYVYYLNVTSSKNGNSEMNLALKLATFSLLSLTLHSTSSFAEAPAKLSNDPKKAFEKRDADKDGFLTLEEFKSLMKDDTNRKKADSWFQNRDKDGNGKLSFDEFKSGLTTKKK